MNQTGRNSAVFVKPVSGCNPLGPLVIRADKRDRERPRLSGRDEILLGYVQLVKRFRKFV